jgi:hypothetical protein
MESKTLKENTTGAVLEAILLGVGGGDRPAESSEMSAAEWNEFEADITAAFERIS